MSTRYADEYFRGFIHGEYEKLKEEQQELERNSVWESFDGTLIAESCPTPIEALELINKGLTTTPQHIFDDTYNHSQLMLVHNGVSTCLRDCALPSVLNTSGWSGSAAKRTTPHKLAIVLSIGFETARAKSQLLIREGKIAAVVSDDYVYMPISELLKRCEYLELSLGGAHFTAGSISHAQTFAQWEFPDVSEEITRAYNSILTGTGRSSTSKLVPVVQFMSSDVSNQSAKLITYLKIDNKYLLPLSTAAVEHKATKSKLSNMEQFEEEISQLYSKMDYEIRTLIPKMLATPIEYPANVFISLCSEKNARIPQKWGGLVEENLRYDWPDHSGCTFLDIYQALTEVTALAVQDGNKPYSDRVLKLEEGIAKIARNPAKWTEYDLPGTVAWTPGKVSA